MAVGALVCFDLGAHLKQIMRVINVDRRGSVKHFHNILLEQRLVVVYPYGRGRVRTKNHSHAGFNLALFYGLGNLVSYVNDLKLGCSVDFYFFIVSHMCFFPPLAVSAVASAEAGRGRVREGGKLFSDSFLNSA